MENKNKKKVLIFSILGVLLIGIAVSFAYWQIVLQQENTNAVTTECFQINFTDGNSINIKDAHPVSDEEGLTSTAYDFTITNVCDSSANFQINLETLSVSGKQLPDKYLKVNLMEDKESKITTKLLSEIEVDPTIEGAIKSYKLLEGVLTSNEEKTFHLRIWMHSDVLATDLDSMNATYNGRVSVITSYTKTAIDIIKKIPIVTSGNGLYEVSHNDANITYTSDETAINHLKQTELRYAGKNPDNYVRFNNELWRIIGLVNTPEGQRLKIRRNELILGGSWDTSASENGGYGVNEWSQGDLMNVLNNGLYYNRTSGRCYNGQGNVTTACDFSNTGLLEESKAMIDTITWNTGSNGSSDATKLSTKHFYNLERSNNTGKMNCNFAPFCTDTAIRKTTWQGKVGLIYPSDYGYATSGGSTTTREECLNKELYQWKNVDCVNNDWVYHQYGYQWTMMAHFSGTHAVFGYAVTYDGTLYNSPVYGDSVSYPVLYLKNDLKILDGNGTFASPYKLGF